MAKAFRREMLERISPALLLRRLRATGWRPVTERKTGTVWQISIGGREGLAFVPRDATYSDYVLRVAEVIEDMADAEGVSLIEVYLDLIGGWKLHEVLLRGALPAPGPLDQGPDVEAPTRGPAST